MVENERKPTFVEYGTALKRGVSWWGKSEGLRSKATVPIDDEREINKILSVFGTNLYKGTETGTTIIIPYIDSKALLSEAYPDNEPASEKPYWAQSVSEYLYVAIQRWYSPRLCNTNYKHGAYLKAYVNGSPETVDNMQPLFRATRELYLYAENIAPDKDSIIGELDLAHLLRSCQIELIE